jgi:hypothetical protein
MVEWTEEHRLLCSMYWVDMGILYLYWLLKGESCAAMEDRFGIPHSTSAEVLRFMRSRVSISVDFQLNF